MSFVPRRAGIFAALGDHFKRGDLWTVGIGLAVGGRREIWIAAAIGRRRAIERRDARSRIELRQAIEGLVGISVLRPVLAKLPEVVIKRTILLRQKNDVIESFNVRGIWGWATPNRRRIADGAAAAKKKTHRTEPAKGSAFHEPGHRMAVPFACSRAGGPGAPAVATT